MGVVKLLNVGESGAGKSGAMASLIIAGYHLWMLDYDNGVDIIHSVLAYHYRDDPDGHASALSRLHVESIRDTITFANGMPRIKAPVHAYKDAGRTLAKWEADKFTSRDVLSLDSLTTFTEAGFNEALSIGGRLNQRPQLQDYGWMADSVKLFIEFLTSDELACNVVVNTHVRYFAGDEESATQARGLPNAKGQEVSRIVSRYFNTVVYTRSQGTGAATRRIISTRPQGVVEVKTSNPFGVKATYSVEEGLAPLFADILGHGPPAPDSPAPTVQTPTKEPQPHG